MQPIWSWIFILITGVLLGAWTNEKDLAKLCDQSGHVKLADNVYKCEKVKG